MIKCPKCGSEYGYSDGTAYNCPECFHIWTEADLEKELESKKKFDSVGNELNEGDDVTIVLDLKLGGDTIKRGTKAKNIQFLDKEVNGHDIQGRVDGFGNLYLKTSVVKKL